MQHLRSYFFPLDWWIFICVFTKCSAVRKRIIRKFMKPYVYSSTSSFSANFCFKRMKTAHNTKESARQFANINENFSQFFFRWFPIQSFVCVFFFSFCLLYCVPGFWPRRLISGNDKYFIIEKINCTIVYRRVYVG